MIMIALLSGFSVNGDTHFLCFPFGFGFSVHPLRYVRAGRKPGSVSLDSHRVKRGR
jgi:hypothetical protein